MYTAHHSQTNRPAALPLAWWSALLLIDFLEFLKYLENYDKSISFYGIINIALLVNILYGNIL